MPIINFPFYSTAPGQILRPMLPIKLINPTNGLSIKAWGLIDTGADECAIPAQYANILGHNLTLGPTKPIGTGNGITNAFAHTSRIEIYSINDMAHVVHTISDTPIDFMPNLHVILLGVKNFLSRFKLSVDYPNKVFSIQK